MFRLIARHVFSPAAMLVAIPMLIGLSNPASTGNPLDSFRYNVSAPRFESAVRGFADLGRLGGGGGGVYINNGPIFLH